MNKTKKRFSEGFTLVELLVMVIILGVLTAIAIPQYLIALDKAHFAKLQSMGMWIQRSYENQHYVDTYFGITQEYPASFEALDIEFTSKYNVSHYKGTSCMIFKDSYCCVAKRIIGTQEPAITCGRNDYSYAYQYRPKNDSEKQKNCLAANGNTRAERLCSNLGTDKHHHGNLPTPYTHNTNNGKYYSAWYLK